MTLMTEDSLSAAMSELRDWTVADDGKAIGRLFRFDGFPSAMAWMVRVGFAAEAANHHPEWRNVYNRVEVRLTTHDAGGVTAKDVELAKAMDRLNGAA